MFSAEYHIRTLDVLLGSLRNVLPRHALVKSIILSLLSRLREAASGGLLVTASTSGAAATTAGDAADGNVSNDNSAQQQKQQQNDDTDGANADRFSVTTLRDALSGGLDTGPVPACRLPGVPADVDVFGTILRAVVAISVDPQGPFGSGGSAATSAQPFDASSPPPAVTAAVPPPLPRTASLGATALASMRTASYVASGEAIASLLQIYSALLGFALAVYPGHARYVDAVLAAASESLTHMLGGSTPAAVAAAAPAEAVVTPVVTSEADGAAVADAAAATSDGETSTSPELQRLLESAPPDRGTAGVGGAAAAVGMLLQGSGRGVGGYRALPSLRVALNDECSQLLVDLLSAAQSSLGLGVLQLPAYPGLLAPLRSGHRRAVASTLMEAVFGAGVRIVDAATATVLCGVISPLMTPADGESEDDAAAAAASTASNIARRVTFGETGGRAADARIASLERESTALARLIGLLGGTTDAAFAAAAAAATGDERVPTAGSTVELDTDAHFYVYRVAVSFLAGAAASIVATDTSSAANTDTISRLPYAAAVRVASTFPPLVTGALALARRAHAREVAAANSSAAAPFAALPPLRVGSKRIFGLAHEIIATLAATGSHSPLALRLFLDAAVAATGVAPSPVVLEFYSQGECWCASGRPPGATTTST